MNISRKKHLARLMSAAWKLARQGAQRFGGSATLYFAIALHLVWQDSTAKPQAVFHRGLGMQYWFPGLAMVAQVKKGQCLLPGLCMEKA
ncbi:MAG: alanyl-tRNA synthetase [Desulfovibrionaceae bacterium]